MGDAPRPTRRTVLKAGAAAAATAVTGAVPLAAFALPAEGPRGLTRHQFELLDELAEILIPADDQSGGARAAGVAAYIDSALADEFDAAVKASFLRGLALVDIRAGARHGRPFLEITPPEREAVVAAMAEGEADPQTDEARFFVVLKRRVVHAYYTSRIGIHDDLHYLGNTLQAEYSGIDVSKR